jgi:hypothetical protein
VNVSDMPYREFTQVKASERQCYYPRTVKPVQILVYGPTHGFMSVIAGVYGSFPVIANENPCCEPTTFCTVYCLFCALRYDSVPSGKRIPLWPKLMVKSFFRKTFMQVFKSERDSKNASSAIAINPNFGNEAESTLLGHTTRTHKHDVLVPLTEFGSDSSFN